MLRSHGTGGVMRRAAIGRRHRVLVVDDYRDIAESICSMLEMLGQECRMATTGREALEEASGFDPEIAIIDLALPDISGMDVACALRSQAAGQRLYIAALTAGWARPGLRDAIFAAGFDQYVLKPGNLAELLQAASEHLSSEPPRLGLSSCWVAAQPVAEIQ
jgi:DNA-binding response OmpR family regulator